MKSALAILLIGGVLGACAGGAKTEAPAKAPSAEDEYALTMMHGMWFAVHGGDPIDPNNKPTCIGTGADRAHAVQMHSAAHGDGWIDDVIPCALSLYPGAQMGASGFVVADGHYYSVAVIVDPSGTRHEVFTDVTPWAKDFMSQLHH